MNESIYEQYIRAGEIAADARDYGKTLIKENVRYLDVVEQIEKRIRNQGAGIAFPVNISINHLAAHYTPFSNDPLVFHTGDLVKLDVGAHINGFIADTAVTIEVGTTQYSSLIQASEDALTAALNMVRPSIDFSLIGAEIEKTILGHGFKPIDNLTGHSMQQFELHSGVSVPNIGRTRHGIKAKKHDVLAIEPFATTGIGHVITGKGSNIYLCNPPSLRSKLVRDPKTLNSYKKIKSVFGTLPFAHRWCYPLFEKTTDIILSRLTNLGMIRHYPQLLEAQQGMVSQKEHTVLVTDTGCEVIT